MIEKRTFEHPIYGTIEKWFIIYNDGTSEFWGYDELGILNGGKEIGDWIQEN
jgi:hypothetical protein